MIVYKVVRWAGNRATTRKMRTSDKRKRAMQELRRYRRQWYWHADKWDQRHGITEE